MTYSVDITWPTVFGAVSESMFLSAEFPLVGPLPSPLSVPGMPSLFERFLGTMRPSDFLRPYIIGVRPKASRRGPSLSTTTARRRISRVPRRSLACMRGVCDRAGSRRVSRWRRAGCGLPFPFTTSAPRSRLSRLDTQPACSPVNASPRPCGTSRHDLGSLWFAGPLTYETFIHYDLPA